MSEALPWAIAAAIVVVALPVGFGIRTLLGKLARSGEQVAPVTPWSWRDLTVGLLRDLSVVLTGVAGVWIAMVVAPVPGDIRRIVSQILVGILILAVAWALSRIAAGIVTAAALARSGVAQSVSLFANISRAVVLGIGLLILLQTAGISIGPLLGALGVGGLAVALALQDTLANLFAGIQILASKKVQVGDFVRLDSGDDGWIVDITWDNTTIRQIPGNMVIVPNHKFADAIITNFHQPAQDMSVLVEVGVSYHSDLEHVERVTIEVGREVMADLDAAVTDHEPLVRFHNFGDSSIDFRVILRTLEFADQYLIVSEFMKRLHERYRDEGIEIPFPIRTLELPDGLGLHATPADFQRASAPN